MASARPTALAVLAVLAALSCMSTGCAPATTDTLPQRAPSPPRVGAAPKLDSTRDQRLPIEKYLISPEENVRIERARSALMTSCMKRFGFDFDAENPNLGKKQNQTSHRYDPTDPAVAAVTGYHGAQEQARGAARPSRKPLSPDMERVLGHGRNAPSLPGAGALPPGAEYHGITVPKGGCVGEAEAKLTAGGGTIQDAQAAVDINFDGYVRSMADARLKSVFAEWSACMKAEGFGYPNPEAAVKDPAWRSPAPSKRERDTAAADARCKRKTNVVGTWFAVESAYEKREIQAGAGRMARVRRSIDVTLKNAAATEAAGK
ncbi:hypothetical protein ACIPRD_21875 [Streptomyces sp. NPDC090108]|uniref:hypothetical protein n=1 Tax=Streptomyces sp. NPDC090108 TaxID=3365947 RepID=UPI00381DF0F6